MIKRPYNLSVMKAQTAFRISDPVIRIIDFFLWLMLLITIIALFVPFSPKMPTDGIDPSWQFGLNQAVAQWLSFGNDIILTFGPYSSIYTKLYHPSTVLLMIGGSIFLALSFWASCVLLMSGITRYWIIIFCITLAGIRYSTDTLLFSLPLILGILTLKMVMTTNNRMIHSRWAPLFISLLFFPLGLLPLIKGSLLVICIAIPLLCTTLFIVNRLKLLALTVIIAPTVSLCLFWILSGQSISDLPEYFMGLGPIISGYTESMATEGKTSEVVVYLIASALMFFVILIQTRLTAIQRVFLFCIFSVFLFLSFKAGFVRHDAHAVTSATSVLLAALLLPFVLKTRMIIPVIVTALFTWYVIQVNYIKTSPANIGKNLVSTYSKAWGCFGKTISNKNWQRVAFDNALNIIQLRNHFPVLNGSTDIYSFNQSSLIASGNTWSPRPVFQSYAVFSPVLAEINRQHLLGIKSPENIIFSVEPIDGRVPSIEDGPSWPVLLSDYKPSRLEKNFLFLQKRRDIHHSEEPIILKSGIHTFGERIMLPDSGQPIFVRITVDPTLAGRLVGFLFKPSQLQITCELKNGSKKQFRLIAGMAKAGFIISPLIESTNEFTMLFGQNGYLDRKQVKSIAVEPRDGPGMLWKERFSVTFIQIKQIFAIDISEVEGLFETISDLFPAGYTESTPMNCDGSIDVINGTFPAPEYVETSEFLSVEGWLAYSAKEGIASDDVFITLKNDAGLTKYIPTHCKPRIDVNNAFKQPAMADVGYEAIIDVKLLKGSYIMGIAMGYKGRLTQCNQFEIPVKFGVIE